MGIRRLVKKIDEDAPKLQIKGEVFALLLSRV